MSEAYRPKHSINPRKSPEHVAQQVDHITEMLQDRAERFGRRFAEEFDILRDYSSSDDFSSEHGGHGDYEGEKETAVRAGFSARKKDGILAPRSTTTELETDLTNTSTGAKISTSISREHHKPSLFETILAREDRKYHVPLKGDHISIRTRSKSSEQADESRGTVSIGDKKGRFTGKPKRSIEYIGNDLSPVRGRKAKREARRKLVEALAGSRSAMAITEGHASRLKRDPEARSGRRRLRHNKEIVDKLKEQRESMGKEYRAKIEGRINSLTDESQELREAHSHRDVELMEKSGYKPHSNIDRL